MKPSARAFQYYHVAMRVYLVIASVFLLPPTSMAMASWVFQISWGDGNSTVYSYPTSVWNDCLFDLHKDILLCDHDHDYDEIKTRMTYDPEMLEYLSVRCLAQTYHPAHQKWCFCKGNTSLFLSTASTLEDTSDELGPISVSSSLSTEPEREQASGVPVQDNTNVLISTSLTPPRQPPPPPSPPPSSSSESSALSFTSFKDQKESFTLCQLYRLYPEMFHGLNSLEVLDLSNNWIVSIHQNTFMDLTSLKVISLRNNPLSQLRNSEICLPPNLQILDLSFSQLGEFPATSLQNCPILTEYKPVSLIYLDLSASRLREIPIRACWYFGNLRFLNISENNIRSVPDNPFIGAFNLTVLDLSNNQLQELPETFCEGLPNLKHLMLANNLLQAVDFDALSLCEKLHSLDLSMNSLEEFDNLPLQLSHLDLFNASGNRLREINASLFETNSAVRVLDLAHNNLHSLSRQTLANATHLTRLFLQHNVLRESEADLDAVTRYCIELRHLDISHNHFTTISAGFFSHLDHLTELDLSSNLIEFVHSNAFIGLVSLQSLSLANNLLFVIENGTFSSLPSLHALNLSGNALDENSTMLGNASSVEILDLSRNRHTKIPNLMMFCLSVLNLARNFITSLNNHDFDGLSNITHLDLSHNLVADLDSEVFQNLTSLATLNLGHNRIAWLPNDFTSNLINLKYLDLSYNYLSTISRLVLPSSLSVLVLTQNRIASITTIMTIHGTHGMQLSRISLNECRIKHIAADAFRNLIYLREVDLRDNDIEEFPRFEGQPGITYNLSGNPLVCSCRMAWLMTLFQPHVHADIHSNYVINSCALHPRHHVVHVKSLTRQNFLCPVTVMCPDDCSCFAQEASSKPEIVMCSGTNLSSIPETLPEKSKVIYLDGNDFGELEDISGTNLTWEELYLNSSGIYNISTNFFENMSSLFLFDVSDNFLETLQQSWFDNLKNLSILNVGHNRISALPSNLLSTQQHLQLLNLSSNRLQYMSGEILNTLINLPRLNEIYLGNNEWVCDCQNEAFIEWTKSQFDNERREEGGDLQSESVRVRDLFLMTCEGISLTNVDMEEFDCDGSEHRRKITILVVCIVFFFVCCLASFCFYHRKVVAAILYYRFRLTFAKSPAPQDRELELSGQFDITVICDYTDSKIQWWVESILVPKLRHPKWRFSVKYPRQPHVQQDEGHTEMTVHNVNRSRCSLMVITSGFARSHQCLACFQKALQRKRAGLHSMVLLTWGHITAEVMNSGFRPFINKGLFLPITARLFWERLFYQLPLPRHKLVMGQYRHLANSYQLRDKDESGGNTSSKSADQANERKEEGHVKYASYMGARKFHGRKDDKQNGRTNRMRF